MGHNVYLFAGHLEVLRRYRDASTHAHLYRLTPAAELVVMPMDEALQDDLHQRFGTGEWLDVLRLTSSDMVFAAEVSRRGTLAYIETSYFGGAGLQAAALWGGGALAIRPLSMTNEQSAGRPVATRPINAALRGLGVVAAGRADEFDTFGLSQYRSNADIVTHGIPVRI
jgi:hypothetical protein